jgi:hypothetical protein
VLILAGCRGHNTKHEKQTEPITTPDNYPKFSYYNGNFCRGNYIWTGAMSIAWKDMSDSLVGWDIRLKTADATANQTLQMLYNSLISKYDIDDNTYCYRYGFGQRGVDFINMEIKRRFPNKPFAPLTVKPDENELVLYSYFLKKIQLENSYKKCNMLFNNIPVQGFTPRSRDSFAGRLRDYKDKDHFLLSLYPNNKDVALFLAKGYPMDNPNQVLADIQNLQKKSWKGRERAWNIHDSLRVPAINLASIRTYDEIAGQYIANQSHKNSKINSIIESTCFAMDESNDNVSYYRGLYPDEIGSYPEDALTFDFDKPFWIVIKKYKTDSPSFIMGVNNTAFMKTIP